MGNFSFSNVPVIRHSRSRFDLSHGLKTSANVGDLVPFEVQEVYPGDTFKVKTSCVTRLTSQFFRPVVDNLFLDTYYFFVPSRILYDKFKNVFGENTESAWANTVDYQVPFIPGGTGSQVPSKTVGDYLGLPVGVNLGAPVSVLPFRAFAKIYDDWFRDQNNVAPMHIQTGERATSEAFNDNAWSPNNYTGKLPKVAKMHDYFTTCLPSPQKGDPINLTIANFSDVPVGAQNNTHTFGSSVAPRLVGTVLPLSLNASQAYSAFVANGSSGGPSSSGYFSVLNSTGSASSGTTPATFQNLWAKTSDLTVNPISVNDLRFAFQYQKMLERDARSGSRYVEYLQGHFGVSAGDYRLQRSEFLGGKRSPITITQVTQTTGADVNSETNDPVTLGSVGAYSLSNSRSRFTKGFVEHGYVIGVFCIRQFHTYQQGIERFWRRTARTDFYDPVFANIGEQPVYKTELFGKATGNQVFGYNEAWADLRMRLSHITGQMRSGVENSLDVWHFGDLYNTAPVLSQEFIEETSRYVDDTITVRSTVQDQFLLDFYISNIAYRPLPTYSVPSLIDHN